MNKFKTGMTAPATAAALAAGSVTLEFKDVSLTQEGFLKGRARVTGVSVLDYTEMFGAWVYRPEEEVFRPESLESLKGLPITIGHPPANLTSETAEGKTVGWTGDDVQRDGDSITVNFTIIAAWVVQEILSALKKGRRVQFSVGAWAFPEQSEGVYNGQAYQVIWRNIIYNHLALLLWEQGRYPETEIVTDSKAAGKWLLTMSGPLFAVDTKTNGGNTVKIKLPNGFEIEVADAEASYLQNHLKEFAQVVTDHATAQGQISALQKSLQKAQSSVMDAQTINRVVSERLALALEAQPLMDSDTTVEQLAAMDSAQLYEQVLGNNGYDAEELASQKTALGDAAYMGFLKGAYSQVVRTAGANESELIMDLADKASAKSAAKAKTNGNGDEVYVTDEFAAAKNKAGN